MCGLTKLERRRSRGDLIEAYKIITGKKVLEREGYFELVPNKSTRGQRYMYELFISETKSSVRAGARVVDLRNGFRSYCSTVAVDRITVIK